MSVSSPAGARTVAFKSLGCKLNQYEIQAMREGFLKHGFSEVPCEAPADYYVLNTCTVTEGADSDARSLIKAFHAKNPSAEIIVTGCYATASPEEVGAMPGVTRVVDNKSKNRILFKVTGIPETDEEESPFFKDGIRFFEERSRAFLKIQDGCNYFCSFCKIPYVRGRLVSRDAAQVIEETRRLVDAGYREIVLSGVCLGSYGNDRGEGRRLASLIEDIVAIEGDFRVRLSSIDPRATPLDLADLLAHPKVCRHLHLSLQSGDDATLARMRRGYDAPEFESLVEDIRRRVPGVGFSTDVIVGFPGETAEEFANTKKFLERIRFHKVHIFPYSEREKTQAVRLAGKLPGSVVKARVRELKSALEPVTASCLESRVGTEARVLIESRRVSDGLWQGFDSDYVRCLVDGGEDLKGQFVRARGASVRGEALYCERLS